MKTNRPYKEASIKRTNKLNAIAQSPAGRRLLQFTLPEIEAALKQIAQIVPVGNVPTLILSGLFRLPGRSLSTTSVNQNINLRFKGLEQVLVSAAYGLFFAGLMVWLRFLKGQIDASVRVKNLFLTNGIKMVEVLGKN